MRTDDIGSALYLVVLLVIVLMGFIFRREITLSKAVKYTLIWTLVIVVSVILYSYRHEFGGFKNRILTELNPSSAVIDDKKRIIVSSSNDGHFYINLKINGNNVLFMVDTGASSVILAYDDAISIGIDPKELNFSIRYQTANGVVLGAPIKVDNVEISGVRFRDVKMSVNKADMSTSLLGMSFLRRFSKYEFAQDKLILTP